MSIYVEFHLIQNFVPSNINRDDTGAPKDAVFGGYRRARISSQCQKRAIRLSAKQMPGVDSEHHGIRTKKLQKLVRERLETLGRSGEDVDTRIETALAAAGLKLDEKGETQYLLFLGQKEISGFVDLINQHWDALATPAGNGEKKSKKEAKASAPPEVQKQAKAIMDGGKAVDVALYGRMLADLPEVNQDAACQVAHAISTHRVEREFDYFTASDDEGGKNESGASMIGQIEFNSATYYRYAVIDPAKLVSNLQDDRELAFAGIRNFVKAIGCAIPTGKQNTFANHNPPSFIGVSLRHASPLNLANAFEKPVASSNGKSLTEQSVAALASYDGKLTGIYGDSRDEWVIIDMTDAWPSDRGDRVSNLDGMSDWVVRKLGEKMGA